MHQVGVDAIRRPDGGIVPGQTYRIVSRHAAVAANDPDYQKAVALMRSALAARGMTEATGGEVAEVEIEVDFGFGPPRTRVQSVAEPGTTVGSVPMADDIGGPRTSRPTIDGRTPQSTVVTTNTGTLVATQVVEKRVTVVAREAGPPGPARAAGAELWRAEAVIEDAGADIRPYLPLLIEAASKYFGENTGRRIVVQVAAPR
jgi:hypothetical protein